MCAEIVNVFGKFDLDGRIKGIILTGFGQYNCMLNLPLPEKGVSFTSYCIHISLFLRTRICLHFMILRLAHNIVFPRGN